VSNRIVAALCAATLTVGILVGAAGAVLVRDTVAPDRMGMDGSMGSMMTMMGGSMMGGADVDDVVEWHAQHHGAQR
jgi:hypothetical protein